MCLLVVGVGRDWRGNEWQWFEEFWAFHVFFFSSRLSPIEVLVKEVVFLLLFLPCRRFFLMNTYL